MNKQVSTFKNLHARELHHEVVTGELRVADGSRFGVTLEKWQNQEKKPKKPAVCADCRHYTRNTFPRCKLGYVVKANSSACKQGILAK